MLLLNTMKRYPLLEKIKYDVITTKEVKAFNFVKLTKKKHRNASGRDNTF